MADLIDRRYLVLVAAAAALLGAATALTGWWIPAGIVAVVGLGALLPRYRVLAALAGAALPFAPVLAVPVPGVRVAVADALAVLAVVSFLATRSYRQVCVGSLLAPIKPGLRLVALFAAAAVIVTWNAGASVTSFAEIAQRVEIVVVWMLFGVLVHRAGLIERILTAYVAACLVISALWIATPGASGVFGMQKNPSGGFLASAILVVLLSKLPNSRRLPIIVVLAAGLIATGSRGSVLGLAAAIGLLLLFARHWRRTILPLAAVCVAAGGVLLMLPSDLQDRLLSRNANGLYTERIRAVLTEDALQQFERAPGGVGVGNYRQRAAALQNIDTHDPHNVFVLHLVEGGYLLATAFVLLAAGSIVWLLRHPKTELVVLALAVQVSILAHAYVDVYWVRGTPSLGWLLLGAAAAYWSGVRSDAEGDRDRRAGLAADPGSHRKGIADPVLVPAVDVRGRVLRARHAR